MSVAGPPRGPVGLPAPLSARAGGGGLLLCGADGTLEGLASSGHRAALAGVLPTWSANRQNGAGLLSGMPIDGRITVLGRGRFRLCGRGAGVVMVSGGLSCIQAPDVSVGDDPAARPVRRSGRRDASGDGLSEKAGSGCGASYDASAGPRSGV